MLRYKRFQNKITGKISAAHSSRSHIFSFFLFPFSFFPLFPFAFFHLFPFFALSAGESTPSLKDTEMAILIPEDEASILKKIQEQTARDKAIKKAVVFLLSQQKENGAFGDKYPVAMTGLSIMALMAAGHTPDDPTHGAAIRRGLEYVLSLACEDGYISYKDNCNMYGHGICALMLTEAAGMTRDEALEHRLIKVCKRAIKLILDAQAIRKSSDMQGGWRYYPNSTDSDLSLTGWQTMALRSAKNIGINVPDAAIQAAIAYICRHIRSDGSALYYQMKEGSSELIGVGLLALSVCGVHDAPELIKGATKILSEPPRWGYVHFYYYIYYDTMGMYQMGDKFWNRFYPIVDDLLLKHQKADGSWPDPGGEHSNLVYVTAMATLSLAIHYHLLPIYQR